MRKIGCIEPIKLTPAEKGRHKKVMIEAHNLLSSASAAKGMSVRKYRDEFFAGDLILSDEKIVKALRALQQLEPVLIAGYVIQIMVLVRAFHHNNKSKIHLSESDWVQEAAIAIRDAVYGYNGTAEFSTYVYHVVKKRLSSVSTQGKHQPLKGLGSNTIKLKNRFKELKNGGMSQEEALSELKKQGVHQRLLNGIVLSTTKVLNVDEMDLWASHEDGEERQKRVMEMMRTIKQADLTRVEREIINDYLKSDPEERGWQKKVAEERGVSKQYVSQVFVRACKKIIEEAGLAKAA